MKRLPLVPMGGLLAARARIVGGCHFAKLLQSPGGGGPSTGPHLTFTGQPRDVATGQPIAPAVRVTVQDSTGQPNAGFGGPVTVGLAANPGSATLSGELQVNAV